MLAIKAHVDEDRKPGRYLLTGSANILTLSQVADSLAGRMEIITLRPLSQSEINNTRENMIDILFDTSPLNIEISGTNRKNLIDKIIVGGYPELIQRKSLKRRAAWFDSYITTILERDMRDLSHIQDLTALPKLLRFLAARISTLLNQSEISRSSGIPKALSY